MLQADVPKGEFRGLGREWGESLHPWGGSLHPWVESLHPHGGESLRPWGATPRPCPPGRGVAGVRGSSPEALEERASRSRARAAPLGGI